MGDSGVGKTSIIARVLYDRFSTHCKATIGADFQIKQIEFEHTIDNETNTFIEDIQVWDMPGFCRFPGVPIAWYRYCDAAIIVYDIKNRRSFESVKNWIEVLLDQTDAKNTNQKISIAIVGNKTDIEYRRKVSSQELQDLCNEYRANNKYFTMERILGVTKSHLLHHGFIRQCQMELSRFIPMDIYKLCFDFYFEFDPSNTIIHGYEVSAKYGVGIKQMFENVIKVCKTAEYYYPYQNPCNFQMPASLDLSDNQTQPRVFLSKRSICLVCTIVIVAACWRYFKG